jgi:hypothetical protein
MPQVRTLAGICIAGGVLLLFAGTIRRWLAGKLLRRDLSKAEYSLREQVANTPYGLGVAMLIYGVWNLVGHYHN